jgi:glycerol-3-phosphate dehydrogenase
MEAFMVDMKSRYKNFSTQTIEYLGKNYGTESAAVFELAGKEKNLAELISEDGQIMASVVYALRNESARTLNDILFRRTGVGNIGHPGEDILDKVAHTAAKELSWDHGKLDQELKIADAALRLPSA